LQKIVRITPPSGAVFLSPCSGQRLTTRSDQLLTSSVPAH